VAHGEQVVNDLESLVSGWVIDGGDIGHACELSGGVVLEEGEGWNDAGRWDVDR
jgi:hypothetical protein